MYFFMLILTFFYRFKYLEVQDYGRFGTEVKEAFPGLKRIPTR